MNNYDVIVLGTGGVGSAALYHLAGHGVKVLGLDRFPAGHDRGSSHGHTRIIRQAYFEHSDYVPLLRRAYQLWSELEHVSGERLYRETGLLEIGPPEGVVVPGVMRSAREHNLAVERLAVAEVARRFPGFRVPDGYEAVFEPQAGYLFVEKCVETHVREATRRGAELRIGDAVVGWTADERSVTVRTAREVFRAQRLIITAGPWAKTLLADLGVRLRVLRKHLYWYATGTDEYRQERGSPCFFYELPAGFFYGFPQLDELGVKVAEHSGGTEVADPLGDDRALEPLDRQRVDAFLASHLPGVLQRPTQHAVCYYTMSPDEHFLLDRHPRHPQVAFAAGLSGHGFKFTGVLGQILAELTLDGATRLPIDFLRVGRFAS